MEQTFKTLEIVKNIIPFLWAKQEKLRSLFHITFGLMFTSIARVSIPFTLKEVEQAIEFTQLKYALKNLAHHYDAVVREIELKLSRRRKTKNSYCKDFSEKVFLNAPESSHIFSIPNRFHCFSEKGA